MRFVEAVNRFGNKTTPLATYRIRLPDLVYYADRLEPIMGVRLANTSDARDSVKLAREQANRDTRLVRGQGAVADRDNPL